MAVQLDILQVGNWDVEKVAEKVDELECMLADRKGKISAEKKVALRALDTENRMVGE